MIKLQTGKLSTAVVSFKNGQGNCLCEELGDEMRASDIERRALPET
jgi:hypothetical protein